MEIQKLPNSFFRKHPLEKLSFARFSFFKLAELKPGAIATLYSNEMAQLLTQERREHFAAEHERIMKLETAEEVIAAIRKEKESLCFDALIRRALELEDTVLPLLLRRYQTSNLERFIETAGNIFAHADIKYSEALFSEYDSIRAPYARAQACIVFAAKGMKQTIPLLVREVDKLGRIEDREYFGSFPSAAVGTVCAAQQGNLKRKKGPI